MSRIGNKPIALVKDVEVKVDGNVVSVKGKNGQSSLFVKSPITVEVNESEILVKRPNDIQKNRALHGLYRTLINNMIIGVSQGYEKKLEVHGVGYRAAKQGNKLTLNLGFSHPVIMEDPEGITVETPSATEIIVKGSDKQLVGSYAAKIRSLRKPEPYKGKGIRYAGEQVRRKEGKTGK